MDHRVPQILLAEADDLLADLVAFRLELLGYAVTRIATGAQLVHRVHEAPPDVILLDIQQPDGDGLEIINRLTSDYETKNVPILVFSLDGELEIVEKAHAAGAKDFLVVPFDPAVLEHKVHRLLNLTVAQTR